MDSPQNYLESSDQLKCQTLIAKSMNNAEILKKTHEFNNLIIEKQFLEKKLQDQSKINKKLRKNKNIAQQHLQLLLKQMKQQHLQILMHKAKLKEPQQKAQTQAIETAMYGKLLESTMQKFRMATEELKQTQMIVQIHQEELASIQATKTIRTKLEAEFKNLTSSVTEIKIENSHLNDKLANCINDSALLIIKIDEQIQENKNTIAEIDRMRAATNEALKRIKIKKIQHQEAVAEKFSDLNQIIDNAKQKNVKIFDELQELATNITVKRNSADEPNDIVADIAKLKSQKIILEGELNELKIEHDLLDLDINNLVSEQKLRTTETVDQCPDVPVINGLKSIGEEIEEQFQDPQLNQQKGKVDIVQPSHPFRHITRRRLF